MTIDEAIKKLSSYARSAKFLAKKSEGEARDKFLKNAENFEQEIEWLRELQERRKQPEIIRCKDCAHYHTDVFGGELGLSGIWKNIIVAHNACDKWTKDMNCVTPDGFCFLAERRVENADVNT